MISMNRTHLFLTKHKHMVKSGAPPDKFGVLYSMFTYRIPWFQSRIDSKGLLLFGSWSYLNFIRYCMGPSNKFC